MTNKGLITRGGEYSALECSAVHNLLFELLHLY